MHSVNRRSLSEALLRYLTQERTNEIMLTLEPLFIRCAHHQYTFGDPAFIEQCDARYVTFLANRACLELEPMSEHIIPHAMKTSVQPSNFLAKFKSQMGGRIESEIAPGRAKNLLIDIRLPKDDS